MKKVYFLAILASIFGFSAIVASDRDGGEFNKKFRKKLALQAKHSSDEDTKSDHDSDSDEDAQRRQRQQYRKTHRRQIRQTEEELIPENLLLNAIKHNQFDVAIPYIFMCDVNRKDSQGKTALQLLKKKALELQKILIKNGALPYNSRTEKIRAEALAEKPSKQAQVYLNAVATQAASDLPIPDLVALVVSYVDHLEAHRLAVVHNMALRLAPLLPQKSSTEQEKDESTGT